LRASSPTNVHQERHHHADRAGHAGGVGVQVAERGAAPALGVPGHALDQRIGQRLRDAVGGDGVGEGAVDRRVPGATRIGGGETRVQIGQRVGTPAEVDGVVRRAAEGVERGRRVAHPARQKQGGGPERPGAAGQCGPAGREIRGGVGVGNR
jgi:hypothetical protein